MAADDRCVWLYAVTDDPAAATRPPGVAAARPAGDLIGVGAGVPRPVRAAGLAAIVGDVAQREFGEAALRGNLEDLGWLERTARAHHAVIEAVARRCPVVPMRLATIYSSDASVLAMLRQRAADFRDALSRTAACSEWGVKAVAAVSAPGPAPGARGTASGSAAAEADGGATGPGAAYLRRRRAQLTARTDARRAATASARDIYEELRRLAVTARLYPPQASDLTGQPAPMILNAAYLVADTQADAFAAAVRTLSGQHASVELTLTGPWPAYSFVTAGEGRSAQ